MSFMSSSKKSNRDISTAHCICCCRCKPWRWWYIGCWEWSPMPTTRPPPHSAFCTPWSHMTGTSWNAAKSSKLHSTLLCCITGVLRNVVIIWRGSRADVATWKIVCYLCEWRWWFQCIGYDYMAYGFHGPQVGPLGAVASKWPFISFVFQ